MAGYLMSRWTTDNKTQPNTCVLGFSGDTWCIAFIEADDPAVQAQAAAPPNAGLGMTVTEFDEFIASEAGDSPSVPDSFSRADIYANTLRKAVSVI